MAGVIKGVSDSAPSLSKLDLLAKGTGAVIYDESGNELQTLSTSSERKEYVKLDKIPACVQYAFVAAVDSRFYEHKVWICQQSFRNLSMIFLKRSGKKHKYDHAAASSKSSDLERKWQLCIRKVYEKIQEQYLAVQLEQKLDKEQILEYYLNTINLGQNAIECKMLPCDILIKIFRSFQYRRRQFWQEHSRIQQMITDHQSGK